MRGKAKKKPSLSEEEVRGLRMKNWLGCKEVSLLLHVSESKVKMLWNEGRLIYKLASDKRGTRKSSFRMVEDYQRREMNFKYKTI